jgi:hypothetical protein
MMAREAAVYELLTHPGEPLYGLCPAFYGFDRQNQVLITELLASAPIVANADSPICSVAFATAAAHTLARLHRRSIESLTGTSLVGYFDHQPPGIYTVHRDGPLLQWLRGGQLVIVDRVRNSPVLASALDRMTSEWTGTRLIHGDVKWENCLWTTAVGRAGSMQWIDWELADLGDPDWDAGCFVQAYLSHWIRSLPLQTNLEDRLQDDLNLFPRLRPVLGVFLNEYIVALQIPEADVPVRLDRIMRCAAARMLQMSLEVMHRKAEPTLEALSLFQTSVEIMERPGESLTRLVPRKNSILPNFARRLAC